MRQRNHRPAEKPGAQHIARLRCRAVQVRTMAEGAPGLSHQFSSLQVRGEDSRDRRAKPRRQQISPGNKLNLHKLVDFLSTKKNTHGLTAVSAAR